MTKKIILSTVVATTLLTTSSSALTLKQRIKNLENTVNAQQKTIKALTKKAPSDAPELAGDVEDLDERLELIETRSFTDKIQFGLGMRIEANNIDTTYANGKKPGKEDIIWRTKLNLNLKSKIANNLKFSGRLSSYKNWGDSNTDSTIYANIDSRQGRTPDNSSSLYVERAYLDWVTNPGSEIPIIITLGRQPSSDGPSYQIKEGMARKGTYDALAFDGAADGIVFTANLNKISKGTSARIAYGVPSNTSNGNDSNVTKVINSTVIDTKVTGIFIDQSFSNIGQSNLLQIYHVMAKDFNADSSGTAGLQDVNVGDFDLTGLMFEVSKINNFDFFAHYAKSTAKPNGKSMLNGGYYYGLLSSNAAATCGNTEEKSGHAIWTGARYNMTDWAVGAEYNKGSQNWFSFTYAPNDPLNKLATRGTATEVYASYKVNKNANIRFGVIDIDYDYTGSGSHLGTPLKITDANAATQVKEKKNSYITFNVLF